MESSRARRGSRARPSGRRPLLSCALASVAVLGASAAGTVYVKAQAHPGPGAVSSAAPSPSASVPVSVSASGEASVEPVIQSESGSVSASGEASVEPVIQSESGSESESDSGSGAVAGAVVDRDALLAKAMASVTVPDAAAVSVAVLDMESGRSAVHGTGAFDTASIVKVDILAALLLQAQDAGRRLTAREKAYAAAMIENSDNDSATALWNSIGGAAGLDAANLRFGLTGTRGGDGALWGLTRTTAADQLTLLRQVFGTASRLSGASRTYLQGLMGQIAADQRWGVSAAADGSAWALKNGWLPRTATGLWDVNSIGRVTSGGHDYLVAVLSDGNGTRAEGIALVEAAARAALAAFTDA